MNDSSESIPFGNSNSNDGHHPSGEAQQLLEQFWPNALQEVTNLANYDFRNQELPLARIKRIMKLDDDAAMMMISGEAPVLFAKAAELFISELSLRSWIHTEDNKRRTLQRNDIAMAIAKYDQFDFLIDIVPREELQKSHAHVQQQSPEASTIRLTELPANAQIITPIEALPIDSMTSDQLQAYIQISQQPLNASANSVELSPTLASVSSQMVNDNAFAAFTYNDGNEN